MGGIERIRWLMAVSLIGILADDGRGQIDRTRLQRTSPYLMLETGARTGMCDVLTFSSKGDELIAAGDDKVARVYRIDLNPFAATPARILRWPILRDHKGAIYTMAQSSDESASLVAMAGHGLYGDSVAIADRTSGRIGHYLPTAGTSREIWSLSFTADSRRLLFGTGRGEVLEWDPRRGTDEQSVRRIMPASDRPNNKVRLVRVLGDGSVVAVTQDGAVRRMAANDGDAQVVGRIGFQSVHRAVLSPDRTTIAATGEVIPADGGGDLTFCVRLFSLADKTERQIRLDDPREIPTSIAFSSSGRSLVIGTAILGERASQAGNPGGPFHAIAGGRIHVYDLDRNQFSLRQPIDNSYMVEAVACHPTNPELIASAGGANHELRLWNLGAPAKPAHEICSPGNCRWSVRWSADGKEIGFQDQPNRDPIHPNRRGDGPWRVFRLSEQTLEPAGTTFASVQPLDRYAGWEVRGTPNPYVWEVVDPTGRRHPLDAKSGRYDSAVHNLPQCYSFLPPLEAGRLPRLALGQDFGVSIYDLTADGPRLTRVMTGHEGAVTSLAPSPDGRALVTASRDQTLAGWSLAGWTSQRELGAKFERTGDGKLRVAEVDLGSPFWETGLSRGDVVTMILVSNRLGTAIDETTLLFDRDGSTAARHRFLNADQAKRVTAEGILDYLLEPDPAREIVLVFERDGKEQPPRKTTVRQVPLWKLFATRNDEWLAWRWRDYYFNTNSPQADELAGWQVHAANGLQNTPVFHRLSQLPGKLNPNKVRESFASFANKPEAAMLADVEPPRVVARLTQRPDQNADGLLAVSAEPFSQPQNAADFQSLEQIEVYVNEYKLTVLRPDPGGRLQNETVTIAPALFRRGTNRIRVRAWNRGGAHSDDVVGIDCAFGPERGRLFGLCVGVADYRATAGGRRDLDLYKADVRTRELAELLKRQSASGLYTDVVIADPLVNDAAVPDAIRTALRQFDAKNRLQPNDTLVLYIASHGLQDSGRNGAFAFQLGSDSRLYGSDLRAELEKLNCRRLLLLDACYSGRISHDNEMIRTVTGGIPQLAFAACGPDEVAIYDDEGGGVFTNCLLRILGGGSGPNGPPVIRGSDLATMLARDVPREAETIIEGRLASFTNVRKQTPLFYHQPIRDESDVPLFGWQR